jgi:hypothetical protein
MRTIKKGATDQSVYLEVLDSTSTVGARKTGLAFNSSGIKAYYARNGAAAVQIEVAGALVTQTVAGAHTDAGFVEVHATNMPGVYRLDLPDAAVASGAESVVVSLYGVTGMAQVSTEIQLVDPAADILDAAAGVETGYTLRQAMRLMLAALAGKASGLGTTTAVFRDMADSKDRISATVDADGNRTAVTRDAT